MRSQMMKLTIIGTLVLTLGVATTSTIAQVIGPAAESRNSIQNNQAPVAMALDCPATVVDEDAQVHMHQNADIFTDEENSVACGVDGVGTTANGWARCFDLVAEGITGNLEINTVYFGIQQATIQDILINVNLYIDVDGCPPGTPGEDAVLLATASRIVGPADELGSLKPVHFPQGTVAPAGSTLIVEIESPVDGTVEPTFSFRPRSNSLGQCAPSYIRAADCGLGGWVDLADIGFPDAHLVIKVIGSEEAVSEPQGDTCDDCIPVLGSVIFGSTLDNSAEEQACLIGDTITEWYCYTSPCGGELHIDTCSDATDYDTTLSVWDSCNGNILACNDDACPDFKSEITFFAIAHESYFIRVSGWQGDSGNFGLQFWCFTEEPACGPYDGDCCEANGTPGCNDFGCCDIVCDLDPFCCDNEWDGNCAEMAIAFCDPAVCSDNPACTAKAGDCCEANGTPGCSDPDCCSLICHADPFCCDIEWDSICAGEAEQFCGKLCEGAASPPCPWDLGGDGIIATSDLLVLFSQWGLNGTADFDRSGKVDTIDLLILFANWGPCPQLLVENQKRGKWRGKWCQDELL